MNRVATLWRRFPFLGALLIALTVVSLVLSVSIAHQLQKQNTVSTDSGVFHLAQMEVEFLKFQRALELARYGEGDLDSMRQWFDVFYSRIGTGSSLQTFRPYVGATEFVRALEEIEAFLETAVPYIDAPDEELRANLGELAALADETQATVRDLALSGLSVAIEISGTRRDEINTTLAATAAFLAGAFLGIVALSAWLLGLFRLSEARADEIESQASQMRTIVETSLDAIFVLDAQGRIQRINEVAQALFGLDPEAVAGRRMVPLLFQGASARTQLGFLSEGRRPTPGERWHEMTARDADDVPLPVEISIDGARTAHGCVYVAFIRDISQRRESEAELREARDRALTGERAKAEFLAVMSHEMRTPLNGVLGALELLRDTSLSARQEALVSTIDQSGDLLLGLVNDVLDLAKFESGKVEAEPRAFDLPELVDSVVGSLGILAQGGGLKLAWTAEAGIPKRIVTDPRMLRQVLLNLVGNAIKFTPEGRIDVYLAMNEASELAIEVRDTGIGISEADQTRIFGDFETADPSYARRHRGTGLGLGISRRLAGYLGGRIGVRSAPGQGATFWLTIPVSPANDAEARPPRLRAVPETGRGLKVLLVEDNEINRFVARDFLRAAGHEVTEAMNGAEGVERAAAEIFDVILMDISMPVMDGPSATRAIRRGGGLSSQAAIVGVTAHALPEEIASFRAIGMDDCLFKPLDRRVLRETLARLSAPPAAPETLCDAGRIDALLGVLSRERAQQLAEALSAQMARDLPRLSDPDTPLSERGRIAHDLAGAAAGFGLTRLHTRLAALDRAAKRGEPMPEGDIAALPILWKESHRALQTFLPKVA